MHDLADPARIDLGHEIRTVSFENPTGGRGTAGQTHRGRKGAPSRMLAPGERVVLAGVGGPGRARGLRGAFPPGTAGRPPRGRRGAPSRMLAPGERVVLADVEGPGRVRHLWMTFPPMPPEAMRALWMEVFYDGAAGPSGSPPCPRFFGLPPRPPPPLAL